MNKSRFTFWLLPVVVGGAYLVWVGIRARHEGALGPFLLGGLAVAVPIGILFGLEVFLRKRRNAKWMSGFHLCSAVVFVAAIIILVVYLLRHYA